MEPLIKQGLWALIAGVHSTNAEKLVFFASPLLVSEVALRGAEEGARRAPVV